MLSSAELTPMGNVEARALENARELDAIFQTTLTAVYLGEAVFDKSHQVVDMRFGLTGEDELKLSVIARHLGMSQSLTSHVYQRALCKMQRAAGVQVDEEALAS